LGKNNIGNIKKQLAIIKEVVWQLDKSQERRPLSTTEIDFRNRIKEVYLGLLALEKNQGSSKVETSQH
jgi:hypothetical protein